MASAWNDFWFSPGDPRVLGFIRICCGALILFVHLAYTHDLDQLFGPHAWVDLQLMNEMRTEAPVVGPSADWTDQPAPAKTAAEQEYQVRWGINPHLLASQGHNIWSIWFHVTDPFWMRVVHVGFLICMGLFMVGLFTRVMGVLTWIAIQSYISRAPTTLFGMDAMMSLMLLYLVIGASGDALSLDRLFKRTSGAPSVAANLAIRLIQVHFCIIYLIAGVSKLQGAAWWNGTAVWGTLANTEFCPMTNTLYMGFLHMIAEKRWLWELVTTAGTMGTLVFEISFPFLVWLRWSRWIMIVSAVLLHLSIALTLGLSTFGIVMLTGVASFIPPSAFD
jgi:hypothetical protein